ncbi:hypothetical protein VTO73DRAFT_7137, partial [Trametes versicolor]
MAHIRRRVRSGRRGGRATKFAGPRRAAKRADSVRSQFGYAVRRGQSACRQNGFNRGAGFRRGRRRVRVRDGGERGGAGGGKGNGGGDGDDGGETRMNESARLGEFGAPGAGGFGPTGHARIILRAEETRLCRIRSSRRAYTAGGLPGDGANGGVSLQT